MRTPDEAVGAIVVQSLESPLVRDNIDPVIGDMHRHVAACIAAQKAPRIVLNLAAVWRIDTQGLGALVKIHSAVCRAGGRLVLCGLQEPVEDALAKTKLLGVFPSFRKESEALASFV